VPASVGTRIGVRGPDEVEIQLRSETFQPRDLADQDNTRQVGVGAFSGDRFEGHFGSDSGIIAACDDERRHPCRGV